MRSEYRPGDILAARLVSEVGEPVAVASHRELLSTAVDCGARQIERFATSRTLVARAAAKAAIWGVEAEAVEMESYTILAEAARYGVPAVAVRAISDTVRFRYAIRFCSVPRRARPDSRRRSPRPGAAQAVRFACACLPWRAIAASASRHLADFLDVFAGTLADRLTPIEQDTVAAL